MRAKAKGQRLLEIQEKLPNKMYLPILAFATEMIFSRLSFPEAAVFSVEYTLLFLFIFYNYGPAKAWPLWIGAGTFSNFLVIAVNDFHMPVSAAIFKHQVDPFFMETIAGGQVFGYRISDSDTTLPLLGDIIGVSPFGELIGFASIGDMLLLVGAVLLFYRAIKQD